MTKSFCVLPWIHLSTHPTGNVSLCCQVDSANGKGFASKDNRLLDLNSETDLNVFMNSDPFKRARVQMLAGEFPEACAGCQKQEIAGMKSKRMWDNETHPDFTVDVAKELTLADGTIPVEETLSYVELRLGNLCNLKCKTCNPLSSSAWYSDYNKLESKISWLPSYKQFTKQDRKTLYAWCEDWEFYESVLKYGPSLREIYINGGEPTLIDLHGEFLNKLIELGYSQNIELSYSINMTTPCDKYLEKWKHFKKVIIKASIDDVGDKNSFIRTGTKWTSVLENLEKIIAQNFQVEVMQTISAFNVDSIEDLTSFIITNYPSALIAYNFAKYPEFISIDAVPPEEINKAKFRVFNTTLPDFFKHQLIAGLNSARFSEIANQKFNQYLTELNLLS